LRAEPISMGNWLLVASTTIRGRVSPYLIKAAIQCPGLFHLCFARLLEGFILPSVMNRNKDLIVLCNRLPIHV
jgi:hypothetical protein